MCFKQAVQAQLKCINDLGINCEVIKAETHVESLKDWSKLGSLEDCIKWFKDQQKKKSLSIEDIPIAECRGWSVDKETGWIRHESGEFFIVQGVRVSTSPDREVGTKGWDQPILMQVGYNGGILGLLRKKIDEIPYYLVEAKAEPGNPDGVQICPTLQATFSNLKQAHGGRKPKFAEYFEVTDVRASCYILFEQWMSEDGGRLHLKRNKGMIVEVPQNHDIVIPDGFRWMTLYQIKELIKMNSWVSPHIRGVISCL